MLDEGFKAVAVGVTTDEIDRIVHEACVDRECYPSPLNYYQVRRNGFLGVSKVDVFRISFSRPPKIGTKQSAVGLKQLFVSHIC